MGRGSFSRRSARGYRHPIPHRPTDAPGDTQPPHVEIRTHAPARQPSGDPSCAAETTAALPLTALAPRLAVGDVVFIRVTARPFREVADATGSWTNHVGVFYDTGFNLHSRRQFCSRFVREVLARHTRQPAAQPRTGAGA